MANAKKILITTESHELLVVRRLTSALAQHVCPICSTRGCGVTLDEAKAYTGLSSLELIRHIEAEVIDAYELTTGPLLICQKSLETSLMETNK